MENRIKAIKSAIDFIEDHLKIPISVADIAAAAGYSLYYFIRIFNQTVHLTPYDYLMRRRLSEAALALQDKRRVIDVALDFQFNNHETFTRAFGRIFGMPPIQWREQAFPDERVLMPVLDVPFLETLNSPGFKPPFLVKIDDINLAGLMTALLGDPGTISSLWQALKEALQEHQVNPEQENFWGIRMLPTNPSRHTFYFAAIEISSLENIPPSFVTKTISAGDYICITRPEPSKNPDQVLRILYYSYLPNSGLTLSAPIEIERYDKQCDILIPIHKSSSQRRGELINNV